MKTSDEGMAFIAHLEGVSQTKYKDIVGVWTIGIGATRSEIPDLKSWPMNRKLSLEQVFELFRKSLVKYENAINEALTRKIQQHEFDALVSWCYNVGTGWTTKGTLISDINKGKSKSDIYKKFMMYNKAGGKSSKGVTNRRRKEARLFTQGKYSGGGKANLFPVSSRGYPLTSKGVSIDVRPYISVDRDLEKQEIKQQKEREIIYKKENKPVVIELSLIDEAMLGRFEKFKNKIKNYLTW